MGGGAGVEYYFGYQYAQNDLVCEDWRSRDHSWDYCRIAINFFRDHDIPFWRMTHHDSLVGNATHDNSRYCFAEEDVVYLDYLPSGGTSQLELNSAKGKFVVEWFNPRTGGGLAAGSVKKVDGGGRVSLGEPPSDTAKDWLIVVWKEAKK